MLREQSDLVTPTLRVVYDTRRRWSIEVGTLDGKGPTKDNRRAAVVDQADKPKTHAKLALFGCEDVALLSRVVVKAKLDAKTDHVANKTPKRFALSL